LNFEGEVCAGRSVGSKFEVQCSSTKSGWGRSNRADSDWSADSRVRAFLASDQVRADKAGRAHVSSLLESALALESLKIAAE